MLKDTRRRAFKNILADAMVESNETIVSLSQARDLYPGNIDIDRCEGLIDVYDKASRQLYKLSLAWSTFGQRKEDATHIR